MVDFAQVICQDLRVKDSVHVFFFQNYSNILNYFSEREKKTPLPMGESYTVRVDSPHCRPQGRRASLVWSSE